MGIQEGNEVIRYPFTTGCSDSEGRWAPERRWGAHEEAPCHGLGDGGCRPELRQCSGNGVAAWTRQMLSIENLWGYGTEGEVEDEGSPQFLATRVRNCCH